MSPGRARIRLGGVPHRCVRGSFTIRVRVSVPGAPRLGSVRVRIDHRLVKRTRKARFTVRVNARKLFAGRQTISIRATATDGRSRLIRRRFSRCRPRAVTMPRFTG